MNKIVAQVAVEAIANDPYSYDAETIVAVRAAGVDAGVAQLYLDMLPTVCPTCSALAVTNGACHAFGSGCGYVASAS